MGDQIRYISSMSHVEWICSARGRIFRIAYCVVPELVEGLRIAYCVVPELVEGLRIAYYVLRLSLCAIHLPLNRHMRVGAGA